jgi:threonyl-tRNA synthetase
MKILFVHADYIEFEVKEKAAKTFDPAEVGEKKRVDEVLVAFIAVEKDDEGSMDAVVQECVKNVLDVAGQVKAKRVCLYPYAHLSRSLASAPNAIKALHAIEEGLKGEIEVVCAPFGWYKSFTLSCKGHPLSELSREIKVAKVQPPKVKGENVYIILTQDGKEFEPKDYTIGKDGFSVLVEKEALKVGRGKIAEPRYLRLCKKFGFEWEPMSDTGHMRYGPKASLMYDLAAAYATQVVLGMPCPVYPIKGTNMFNLNEAPVREHAELFGDRLYTVKYDEREFVLRYAACHQQFAMIKDWTLSYRHLPFGAFEIADSYRFEQSGECMLAFRVRRLNMPDLHVFCKDEDEARVWFEKVHDRIFHEIEKLGRDYELLINISSRKHYEEHKEWILSMLKKRRKSALISIYPEGKNYYWTINMEYNIIDVEGREREIATDQIDIGNAKRFGISYVDEKGEKRFPVIIHTAMIGTIERFIYALLDCGVKSELEGKKGTLPLWINPEQIRLLPVSDKHIPLANRYAHKFREVGARVGIDDRTESISRKVRDAKQDWVGYVIVVGDMEETSPTLKVYDRIEDKDRELGVDALCKEFKERTSGYPNAPLYFSAEMSRRPGF